MDITVILNAASGRNDKELAREAIERTLQASGRPFRIVQAPPKGLIAAVRQIVAEARQQPGAHAIVAAGGDGTITTVAGEVAGTGVPMGVIPLGTFNYFARELGIPLDPAEATGAILQSKVRLMPLARVNGHAFLINSSFGLYRRLQEQREQHERRFGRNKLIAALSSLVSLLREHRSYQVFLEADGKPQVLKTPMIFFGFNPLQLEKLGLPEAGCAAQGLLAVLVLRPVGRMELLGLALRGALQTLGESPNMHSYCAARVEVMLPRARRIRVAIDGESMECTLPLRYEVIPDALSVLVPIDPKPRQ